MLAQEIIWKEKFHVRDFERNKYSFQIPYQDSRLPTSAISFLIEP